MAAFVHPCFVAIGLTNSVHPYCRFAIIDMHSTPTTSCHHRPRDAERRSASKIPEGAVMTILYALRPIRRPDERKTPI